jgi:hypothetical protein
MRNLASLWISLSLQRAFLLTTYGQDPFGNLSDVFKANIVLSDHDEVDDQELIKHIRKNKSNSIMNTNNLYSMLNILYNFMTISLVKLTQTSKGRDDDGLTKSQEQLGDDNLKAYLETLVENEIKNNDKFEIEYFNIESFKLKHVYHVWRLIAKLYENQKN